MSILLNTHIVFLVTRLNAPVASLIMTEPRREKTGLWGFRPGPTQTGLYKLRKELEAWNFGFK